MTPFERISIRSRALALLGVSDNPTKSELRKAFRKLAFEKHPDHGRGTPEEFTRISDAYTLLADGAVDEAPADPANQSARPVSRPSVQSIEKVFDEETLDACETIFDQVKTVGNRHLATRLHRRGRELTYYVPSLPKVGVNHVALPTGDLVDSRRIQPKLVDVWSGDLVQRAYDVPAQLCEKLFPGARAVQIRFGRSAQR